MTHQMKRAGFHCFRGWDRSPEWAGQSPSPLIGWLHAGCGGYAHAEPLKGFQDGLAELGFIDGKNVTVEYHWAEGKVDAFPSIAADLRFPAGSRYRGAGVPRRGAGRLARNTDDSGHLWH